MDDFKEEILKKRRERDNKSTKPEPDPEPDSEPGENKTDANVDDVDGQSDDVVEDDLAQMKAAKCGIAQVDAVGDDLAKVVISLSVGKGKPLPQERGVLLTPSVEARLKPNHTKHGKNKNYEYSLAWWCLWWRRMEREGEKDDLMLKNEMESRRSSGFMRKYLNRNKSNVEIEDMEKVEKSIVNLTAVELLEQGGKKRKHSNTGTIQSPAKRGKMYCNEYLGVLDKIGGERDTHTLLRQTTWRGNKNN